MATHIRVSALFLSALGCSDGAEPVPKATGPAWSTPATCTDVASPADATGVVRWPYVQNVTEDAATIAFGVEKGASAGSVSVARDDDYDGPEAISGTTTIVSLRIDDSDDDYPPEPEEDEDTGGEDTAAPFEPGPEAWMDLHHVRLTGLQPGTEYCYRVESDGSEKAKGFRFWTAPATDDTTVKFLVIGDMGAGTEAQELVRDVMLRHAEGSHFIITTGDNAYGDGDRDELHNHVFVAYQELFARMPVYPTLGNHDYKTDQAQPYLDSFFLPEDAWRSQDKERYYTLDFGPVHFIALDTETPAWQATAAEDDDQTDWLGGYAVNTTRPWSIAGFHQPAKAGHPERGAHAVALLQWAPILEEAAVPLVLQGHDHYYERFAPIREGEPTDTEAGGVTYIVTAGGGQSLYEIDYDEPYMVSAELRHHFLRGEADACTLRLQAIDVHDDVFDEVVFDRCSR